MLQDFRAVMVDDSELRSNGDGVCVVQKVCNDDSLGRYFVMEIVDGEYFPYANSTTLRQAKLNMEQCLKNNWETKEEQDGENT
jgi:hypothetical protein